MEAIMQWGMSVIHTVQQIHGPVLDGIFRAITFLGEEEFYLLIMPVILWCIDFRLGAHLSIIFLLSGYFNTGMKDFFRQPRPFDIDPNVQLSAADGYGLPSGHAQSSIIAWAGIASWMKKTWLWVVAVLLIVLIGFSRIYLGVHFPSDVLAGWAAGLIILILYLIVRPVLEKKLRELRPGMQILTALVLPLILLAIHPVADTVSAMAVLAGFGTGLALTHRYVSFTVVGALWQYILRFLTGGGILLALYLGLKMVFPGEESPLYLWFRFFRYGLIGMWVSFGAPWLFCLLGLAPGHRNVKK